ncbi:hypothetical protein CKK34_6422 [Yarrowia sp. E02]|nr:hypothetical protein CKK34_6422 [Yarrowia sp. E02]
MATPRTQKRYGRSGSATKSQPEQMTLMSSFLNARDSPSPGLSNAAPATRDGERNSPIALRSAATKIDFETSASPGQRAPKSPSLGRVTKPAVSKDTKTRPMLFRRTRGASIFDSEPSGSSDVTPGGSTPESAVSVESPAQSGRVATRPKKALKDSTSSKEISDFESQDMELESPVLDTPKVKAQTKKTAPISTPPAQKKTATPTSKGKTPAKRQTAATPTAKVRLTRSRSRSMSPAIASAADKQDTLVTSSSSNGSSNKISPRSSQTLFSSQIGDTEKKKTAAIDLTDAQNAMEVDNQTQPQSEDQAQKEADDQIGLGPKRLFEASETSGFSTTSIFASSQKRKIRDLRTSTPSKKKTKEKKKVSEADNQDESQEKPTTIASFGSSFESSQGSQEQPVRAPITITTNRRTYGANRSYLADSPTKTESIYDSIMSESSGESEHEELHIKSVHELRETGGNARFMDEMEYLAEGLEDEGSSRRTTLLEICKKARDPDFIRKLKTTDYADKILHVLPQVAETDPVASFLVLFIAQKIFGDNGANVLDTVINDPKFLDSVFLCLDNTDSILRDKKSSKVFQKVLKDFVDGTTSAPEDEPAPSPALAAIATLSTLQTYPGASGSAILKSCLQPSNWDRFRSFAINAFEEKEYKVLQLVVFFLDFCQSDIFFSSLAPILDELSLQLQKGKPNSTLVDLSLPVLRLLIVYTNESSIPELDGSFVLKCISLAETLHKQSGDPKLYEVYLLCLGFLENIIGALTSDYQKVYDIFTRLAQGKDDKHCQAFLTLLRKNVATRGALKLSAKDMVELE